MSRQHDPLAMKLSSADDRVLLSKVAAAAGGGCSKS